MRLTAVLVQAATPTAGLTTVITAPAASPTSAVDVGDMLSFAAAVVAIMVAVWTGWRQTRLQAPLTAIEEDRRRDELQVRSSVRIVPRFLYIGESSLRFRLANEGQASHAAWTARSRRRLTCHRRP